MVKRHKVDLNTLGTIGATLPPYREIEMACHGDGKFERSPFHSLLETGMRGCQDDCFIFIINLLGPGYTAWLRLHSAG